MILRAAWSCFLVRKELLVELIRKDEASSWNMQASHVLCPLGTPAGKGR